MADTVRLDREGEKIISIFSLRLDKGTGLEPKNIQVDDEEVLSTLVATQIADIIPLTYGNGYSSPFNCFKRPVCYGRDCHRFRT